MYVMPCIEVNGNVRRLRMIIVFSETLKMLVPCTLFII